MAEALIAGSWPVTPNRIMAATSTDSGATFDTSPAAACVNQGATPH